MAIEAVKRAVEAGGITEDEIETELQAEDLRFLEEKVIVGAWYPVASFDRLVRLASGPAAQNADYFVKRGRDAADELLNSQIYGGFKNTIRERGDQGGTSVLTLAQLMMNFSRWELLPYENGDTSHFVIDVTEAGPMPDVLRYTSQGFIERVSELMVGGPMKVMSERPARDHVIFTGRPAEA
jgi:hypothetical protein